MKDSDRELNLFLVDVDDDSRRRADLIVKALGDRRLVRGTGPTWTAIYAGVETSEAMELCEGDLTEIDPLWGNVLDFGAAPSKPILDLEFRFS